MATKKYVSLSSLTNFLDNLKNLFATKTEMNAKSDKIHTHSISDVTNLQATLNGKAASSHGTHVSYSTTAPVMDGTASVGSASTVARSDHKHPTDTSRASQTSLDTHTSNTTSHITSTERANWNTAHAHSQSAHAPSNAEPNQNAFGNVKIGDVTIAADTKTDAITLVAGNNVTITPDATNDKITISAKDTTYNLGSFGITATAAELNKLDGVTATATEINYVDGVTSNIQNQLDGKAASSHTHKVANISDLTATAAELNYMDGVTSNVQTQLDGKASSGHTHKYAGSSSAGGAATSANKLNTDAGSATQPVYFSSGIPKATTYTLGKSVPSDAKFTDTTYSVATTSASGLMSSTDKKKVDSISGSYSLGSFASKTVADLQAALDTWLNSYVSIANASANFQASQDWVAAWNSGNTATTISAGGTWTVTNIAPYSTKAYAQLRISYYSDEWVVYVHRSNGTWGTAHQAAYKDDLTLKQNTITGGASTITGSNLTANRALVSNGSGKVAISAVTSTELGYLDGVTSNVQTQLDGKSGTSHTHKYAGSSSVGGSATSAVKLDTSTAGDSNTPVYFSGGKPVACTSLDLNTSGSSASCTGNSATATKLQTARTISLSGDVTGSTSFDGSGNVSITTTVADDSHNHTISNVDNLQTTLDAKLPKSGGTVGALTGSSTIAANGTLSGNADTKTPFSTTTDLYYVNKKLTWNSNSYLQHVILLFPVLIATNWFGYNYIEGKFLCWKNGGNVYDTVEISANCVYNSLRYHLEYFGDNPSWALCICKYNGVSYYALNCPYHANPYTNVEFVGHIRSELTGGTNTVSLPLDIPYYNENTSTILNEEVKNSITSTLTTTIVTSASGTPLYSKNGFSGNLSGNASTATKLATARTISLTGDVTGSASFDGSANASITATVADDSHNHVISNVDNLQSILNTKSDNDHRHYPIGISVTGENLNNYTDAGIYTFTNAAAPTNVPAGTNGWLVVMPWIEGSNTIKQLWFRHGTVDSNDFETYVRTKIGENDWGSWSKYYTTSNPPTPAEIGAASAFTSTNGGVKLGFNVSDNKNLLDEIGALSTGVYTIYSQSGVSGNPKTTEAWRMLVHKTSTTIGWVMAFGSSGSVYANYQNEADNFQGWRCVFEATNSMILWTGAYYMHSPSSTPQVVTPSKKLSECRTGWLLLWSDYDASTSTTNDIDFCTTYIPKFAPSGGTWGGKAFYCDIPMYVGSDVTDLSTETRCIKPIYVHDDHIEGSYQNNQGGRNDVVLRAVYEI